MGWVARLAPSGPSARVCCGLRLTPLQHYGVGGPRRAGAAQRGGPLSCADFFSCWKQAGSNTQRLSGNGVEPSQGSALDLSGRDRGETGLPPEILPSKRSGAPTALAQALPRSHTAAAARSMAASGSRPPRRWSCQRRRMRTAPPTRTRPRPM